jgi:hypothetical protein
MRTSAPVNLRQCTTGHKYARTAGSEDVRSGLVAAAQAEIEDPGDDPSKAIVPPAGSDSVTVTGLFTAAGQQSGQLTIPSDDPSAPYIIGLLATVPPAPSPVRRSRTSRTVRTRRR